MSEITLTLEKDFRTKVVSNESTMDLYTDVAREYGGQEEYFSPTDLLAGAVGACMCTIMALYANKIGADITGLSVKVTKELGLRHQFQSIIIKISCPTPVESSVADRLEKAAMNCPVYHALHPDIKKEHHFEWNKK